MKLYERLAIVRRYGPRSPTQRHVLGVLATFDDDDGRMVWPGNKRLADETGYTGRCIQTTLRQLVVGGWLKPEREATMTRPTKVAGTEAWWGHGNLGGRKNSTRYRIVYRVETQNDVPEQPRTTFRDQKLCPDQTQNDVPQTQNDVPLNPERRSGDPSSIRKDPEGGDTPPQTPAPAPAVRHAMQAEMKRSGCAIVDAASFAAWEAIATDVGIERADQVARMVYDLVNGYRAEWKRPPVRPYAAADLSPFVPLAARQRAVLAAFSQRIRA